MKYIKITSVATGILALAATLMPGVASAASAAMSLSGATQANGTFSTVVYENADGPVSSVKLALNFSTAVTNVNYDYSVGPFIATDPDGYHLSQGTQTGAQAIARVSFTLTNPGTVTASVNTASSFVKGTNAEKTAVVYYTVGAANANFTYTAPVSNPSTGGTGSTNNTSTGTKNSTGSASSAPGTTGGSNPSSNKTSNNISNHTNNATTAPTTPSNDKKDTASSKHQSRNGHEIKSRHTGLVTSSIAAFVVLAAAVYWLVIRKRATVTAAPVAYKRNGSDAKKASISKRKKA
jgi:hypothetical protein